jgi:hypothetical protein
MSNIEVGPAEKATSTNVRATSDRGDVALHVEDESISFPPDGGYGWTIVVAILFLNAVTWGTACRSNGPTPADLRQDSTLRLESIYLTLRHSRPSRTPLHLCIRLSGVFQLLSLYYAHHWRTS